MVDLLLRAGANPKAANREGSTPLWLACINGDAAIIEALLKAGADANEQLPLGRTPLMVAARTGNVDAIKVLLDHGANVNAKETLRGTTPLMWAADEGHARRHPAADRSMAPISRRDRIRRSAGRGPALGKSNDPRKAVAALAARLAAGIARRNWAPSALRPLSPTATRGARTRPKAANGISGEDNTDDAAVVFGFSCKPRPKDGGGLTPLVYAVRSNDLDSVKALLAAGADVNQVTGYGWSPLLVATQNRYYKLGALSAGTRR